MPTTTKSEQPCQPTVHAAGPLAIFDEFAREVKEQTTLRTDITAAYRRSEHEAMATLLESARLPQAQATKALALASRLATRLREGKTASGRAGLVQGLIQEFSLSSQEGVAPPCIHATVAHSSAV